MNSRATIAAAASANAHVVTKVEVVEEIATSGDTVTNSVLPPPGGTWAPPPPPPSDGRADHDRRVGCG